jgi:hypothetical protein
LTVTDALAHSGKHAAQIAYGPAGNGAWLTYSLSRDVPLSGLPQKLSLWVYGDGSGAIPGLAFRTANSGVTYWLPALTWTGWKQLELDLTKDADSHYPGSWDWVTKKACFEGTYLSQFLLRDPPPGKQGKIYLDDLVLATQLNKDFPYVFHAENLAEDNVIAPGAEVAFAVETGNYGQQDKTFTVDYSLTDYWGKTVGQGSLGTKVPAGRKTVEPVRLREPLSHGWYTTRFVLSEQNRTITTSEEPIAVLRPLPRSVFCADNPLGNDSGYGRIVPKVGMAEVYLVRLDDLEKQGPEAATQWRPTAQQLAELKEHNLSGNVMYMAPSWVYLPEGEMTKAAEEWSNRMAGLAQL